ncbi:FadD3 family acyl-CoA ligase [Aquamicrobium sp. LC103]|uniref:FadD3 family acyl-CoA ligase n=1 Tax=Aquamicrobium sp. LC103 TaxID=1120658 RepID=UPI0010C993A2|nr:FadD3 family acyl-CoA ligase [Aquamicrobium sp. LC103]TKT75762.1 fatty acid--CoA ligase [Aquamicrobium sp. LC103]
MAIEGLDSDFTTIPALSARAAEHYGDARAIEDGGVSLTFVELDQWRRRLAKSFMASGIRKGDKVMIWGPNSWKWFATSLGLVSAGAILIPCSTRFKGAEVTELIRRSGTTMLMVVGEFIGQYYPDMLGADARELLRDIVVFDSAREGESTWEDFVSRSASVDDAELNMRAASVGPDDLCDMLFTSGTTGYPKGVMYAHQQCLRAIDAWATRVGIQRGDRILVIPPLFHAFGYRSGAIVSLMRGAVLMPHLTYDPDEILHRVQNEKVSVIPGPPAIFHGMLQHPELAKFDTSSLRLGITGGSVVPATLIRRMRSELGFAGVVNGYGLTECGGYGTMCRADDNDDVIANTSGKPFPDTEVRILDGEGAFLPDGTPGEVVIRGYITMQGYFNDPEATAKTVDKDGWLHTGDIGYFDESGNLRIEDRVKDMYITGGFNCYPAEIERFMSAHPSIGQIAVIGVPDDRLGEVGKAFVVLRPGTTATAQELIAWARANIANFKVPRSIEFRQSLPTSPQGKVVKDQLRTPASQGA